MREPARAKRPGPRCGTWLRTALGLGAVAAVTALGACATAPRVEIDRLADTDLTRHESFALAPELFASPDPAFGPSAREAAHAALVAELRARGLERADDPEQADLLVAVGITTESRLEGGGRFAGPGHAHVHTRRSGVRTPLGDVPLREDRVVVHHEDRLPTGPDREVRYRTVVVDVFEADSKRLVWRGSSRSGRSGARVDPEHVRERVVAIARRFP